MHYNDMKKLCQNKTVEADYFDPVSYQNVN